MNHSEWINWSKVLATVLRVDGSFPWERVGAEDGIGGEGPREGLGHVRPQPLLRPPSTSLPAQLSYLYPAGLCQNLKKERSKAEDPYRIFHFTLEASLNFIRIKAVSALCTFSPHPQGLVHSRCSEKRFDGRILREKERQSLPSNFESLLIRAGWTFISHSLEWYCHCDHFPAWPMWLHMMEWREAEGGGGWVPRIWEQRGRTIQGGVKSKALYTLPVGQALTLGLTVSVNWTQFNLMWLR